MKQSINLKQSFKERVKSFMEAMDSHGDEYLYDLIESLNKRVSVLELRIQELEKLDA